MRESKMCTKCNTEKPLDEFCVSSKRKDGRSSHCKACHNALYYTKRTPRQLVFDGMRLCTKCNTLKPVSEFDSRKEGRDKIHSHCKECRKVMSQSWKDRNKERVARYNAAWNESHGDYHKEHHLRYKTENAERIKQSKQRYYASPVGHIKNVLRTNIRHRAKRIGNVTYDDILRLMKVQTDCAYCHRPFSPDLPATIDHIVPLSKDGTHTLDNITLACKPCNCSKGAAILTDVSDTVLTAAQRLSAYQKER